MRTKPLFLRRFSAAVLTCLLVAWIAPCPLGATPTPGAPAIAELPALGNKGQFDRVLAAIRADKSAGDDSQASGLIKQIEALDKHKAALAGKRHEAYQKAMDKMAKAAKEQKLDEAILAAVEAHGLADDPAATLALPEVAALVKQAEEAIAAADKAGDCLEALNLYRILDLLYDESPRYRNQIKDAERRVRILRLYAPAELNRLYVERAKRLGKDKPEPLNLGNETWEQQLQGVELSMFRTALALAVRKHVSNTNYRALLDGALDDLRVVAGTQPLESTFPAFKDPAKVKQFQDALAAMRQKIAAAKGDISFLDAGGFIDDLLKSNKDSLDLPETVMVYEMTDGALSVLDDYTNLIWPRETEEFRRTTEGKFYGVGIQISRRDSRLVVVSPLEGTPAHRAGIKPGDIIASVNNQSTTGWTLDEAVRTITGPEGTEVTLGIERVGQKDPLPFILKRAEIIIESIRGWQHKAGGGWDYMIDPANKIGYIRLSQFIPQSADDMDAAVNQMEQTGGLNALILDLRFDPGGLLKSAVQVANRFVGEGVIVSTVGPDGKTTDELLARKEKTYANLPVVVLVNEGSASASEIVAGCLQGYHRALIVGARSFGKGSVQDLLPIGNGAAYLKLTTHYYAVPPDNHILHRRPESKTWGVEPDLLVKMTAPQINEEIEYRSDADVLRGAGDPPTTQPARTAADILEKGIDPQLETALLVLQTRLVAQHFAVAQKRQPVTTP